MSDLFSTLRLLIQAGVLLFVVFLVLLALPQSRLREIVMPFVGWGVAALSAAYIVLPIDIVPEAVLGPFGLIDDLLALGVAIGSATRGDQRAQLTAGGMA